MASVTVVIPGDFGTYATGFGKSGSVTCAPGGANNSISGTDVHYSVKKGGATLTMPAISPSASGGERGSACSVSYTASIVNGNWDGPYYFHYGNNYGGDNEGPWPDNTVGSTPAITDIPDGTNFFPHQVTTDSNCITTGTITPVWYWSGPNLGVDPPAFQIYVDRKALASDTNTIPDEDLSAYTGEDGYIQHFPTSTTSTNEDFYRVTVQSDVYAPGEGNGYWAIGPTLDVSAEAGAAGENPPFNLYTSVGLSASITAGY